MSIHNNGVLNEFKKLTEWNNWQWSTLPLQNEREVIILKERQIKDKFLRLSGNCCMSYSCEDQVEPSILVFPNSLPSTVNLCFADEINSNVTKCTNMKLFLSSEKMLQYRSLVVILKIIYHRTHLFRLIFFYKGNTAPQFLLLMDLFPDAWNISNKKRFNAENEARNCVLLHSIIPKLLLKWQNYFSSVVPPFKKFAIAERLLLLVFLGFLFGL